ncbi:MAG: CCA tRNA nucleotidyltransferase, partial [Hyphomicrobiales bacterium]|nr:CCA tRNA nucleotidyltransferase [Hyphomicrobiales bacterium]
APPDGNALAEFAFRAGADVARDALMLAHAQSAAAPDDARWLSAYEALAGMTDLRLPVTGEDLKNRGLTEGRAIGAALKKLQALWIRAGFPRDPAEISKLIEQALYKE